MTAETALKESRMQLVQESLGRPSSRQAVNKAMSRLCEDGTARKLPSRRGKPNRYVLASDFVRHAQERAKREALNRAGAGLDERLREFAGLSPQEARWLRETLSFYGTLADWKKQFDPEKVAKARERNAAEWLKRHKNRQPPPPLPPEVAAFFKALHSLDVEDANAAFEELLRARRKRAGP